MNNSTCILTSRQTTINGDIVTITLNRPEKRNAIHFEMYRALADAIQKASDDPAVLAINLQAEGAYFCGGNDLADFQNVEQIKSFQSQTSDDFPPQTFLLAIANCTKPLVVAVEGGAVGIGATLLLHADFVYAGQSAMFSMPFVALAATAEGGSSYLMPLLAGHKKASDILLLSKPFSAQDALSFGFINAIAPDGGAKAMAEQTLMMLQKLPKSALINSKALMKSHGREQMNAIIREEIQVFVSQITSPEAQARLSSKAK